MTIDPQGDGRCTPDATPAVRPAEARFPALDGLRGFAAAAVVCTHVGFASGLALRPGFVGGALSRGDFGVALFFLLSGFLLYRPFALRALGYGPAVRTGQFLWRRVLRIVPALWLFVAVVLAVFTTGVVRASDYWQYVLLIQTYDHRASNPHMSQLWTLTVEVSFYLLLPLLAWTAWSAVRARLWRGRTSEIHRAVAAQIALIAALALTPIAYNVVLIRMFTGTQARLWLPAFTDWFALGMGLALLSSIPQNWTGQVPILTRARRIAGEWASSVGTCWLVAALLWLISTLPIGNPRDLVPATFWQWNTQHVLYGAAAFFVMLPLVLGDHPLLNRALGGRAGRFAGAISYAVYLWHLPLLARIQSGLGYREFDGHFWVLLALTLLSSIAVASASWYLLERPVLRHASLPWRPRRRGHVRLAIPGVESGQTGPSDPATSAATHSS